MAKILITRRFQKSYEKLDAKTQERVKEALLKIEGDPAAGKSLTGNLSGDFSYRLGDYRIIYSLSKQAIFILTVSHQCGNSRLPLTKSTLTLKEGDKNGEIT